MTAAAPQLRCWGCGRCGENVMASVHAYLPWLDVYPSKERHPFVRPKCRRCGRKVSIFNQSLLCGGLISCDGGDRVRLRD